SPVSRAPARSSSTPSADPTGSGDDGAASRGGCRGSRLSQLRLFAFLEAASGSAYPCSMLQSVEVLPHARRALRRAVRLECRVVSAYWDEPVVDQASDVSPWGLWRETALPLGVGEPLVVSFVPPRADEGGRLFLLARVRRVRLQRRRSDRKRPAGMGIEFVSLTGEEQ